VCFLHRTNGLRTIDARPDHYRGCITKSFSWILSFPSSRFSPITDRRSAAVRVTIRTRQKSRLIFRNIIKVVLLEVQTGNRVCNRVSFCARTSERMVDVAHETTTTRGYSERGKSEEGTRAAGELYNMNAPRRSFGRL